MARLVAAAWFLAILILTAGQGAAIAKRQRDLYRRVEATLAVRRMAENSFRYFEGRRPPAGDAYWKAIGRDAPLLDPWGRSYRLEHLPDGGFLCRSAGEDGYLHSPDDIVHEISSSVTLESLSPGKWNLQPTSEQRVRDAK